MLQYDFVAEERPERLRPAEQYLYAKDSPTIRSPAAKTVLFQIVLICTTHRMPSRDTLGCTSI